MKKIIYIIIKYSFRNSTPTTTTVMFLLIMNGEKLLNVLIHNIWIKRMGCKNYDKINIESNFHH